MIQDQPKPVENENSLEVWMYLKNDIKSVSIQNLLKERVVKGIETYGTLLKTNNGRDAIIDAIQEILDCIFYVKQAELENKIDNLVYKEILNNLILSLNKLLENKER